MGKWKKCTISDLGTVVGGATPSTIIPGNYDGGLIPWITPKDLAGFSGRFISHGERNITEQGLKSCSTQLMPAHTILFSSRAPIGYVAIARNEVCTNQGFKSVIPNNDTDYMFLYYLLKFNKNKIESLGSGTTFKEVSGSTMRGIEVDVPESIEEQRRIALILASLDDKIENNEKLNQNLSCQIQSLYDNLASGLDGETVEISTIVDVRDGTHDSPKSCKIGYPLVTSKHLLPYGVDLSSANLISKEDYDKTNERSLVETHDILISMIGTVGLISLVIDDPVPFSIKNVGLFKTSKNPDLYAFVLAYLRSKSTAQHIETMLAGSTQKYISLSELRKLPIILPDESNLKKYNDIVIPILDQISNLTNENKRLEELRETLLPQLMSGELDVSNLEF